MNKVKCRSIADGPIPSERTVTVLTADGVEEEVIVAKEQAEDGYLLVSALGSEDHRVLVELPRESSSGFWRLWIDRDLVEFAA